MHLAQINVGTIRHELDHPEMAGFTNNLDRINALAEGSYGFVWRLKGEGNNATDLRPSDDPRFIVNMSVWETIDALFAYAYRSEHRDIMVKRRQWFGKPEGPYQALWWVVEGKTPTVEDGLLRLAHLARHGPTPFAFTFRDHSPAGAASSVDLHPEPYCVGWA